MKRHIRHFSTKLHTTILNPLIVVVLVVAAGWLGWNHYLFISRHLNRPVANILPDDTFATLSTNGDPLTSWRVEKNGSMRISGGYRKGYITKRSVAVIVSGYRSGDTDLSSPQATLQPNTTYLFKSFYKSTSGFTLLAKYTLADGSNQEELVRSYPASSTKWTTANDAFKSGKNIRDVQFVLRFSSNGSTTLNETYLEKSNATYIPPALTYTSPNLIQNAALAADSSDNPKDWTNEANGTNNSVADLVQTPTSRFLRITMNSYKDGSTTWQPTATTVQPGQDYTFQVSYQSNAPADIVAMFEWDNHTYHFVTVQSLAPAGTWTTLQSTIVVPKQATTMSVSVVLHHRGIVNTNNYSLYNSTAPGPETWQKPVVSLTFDGWDSEYQNAFGPLKQYKDPGTFYLNPATIGTRGFMDASQLKNLARAGNELAAQGYDYTDLTTLNVAQITTEARAGKSYLQHTFERPITDFAAPYGNTDPLSQTILRKFYTSNRSNMEGINTKQGFDPYTLRVFPVGSNTTLASIQNALAEAQQYNGWLILVYGQIDVARSSGMLTQASFTQQLQAIQKSGLTVEPINAALRDIQS